MSEFLPFTRPTIDEETIAGVADVLRSGWITTGPFVDRFERDLETYLGGDRHLRTMTSATGALEQALVLCGIGPGDEVIVPAMTFAATANVVVRVGATPVFVDVDLRSRNMLMDAFEGAITPCTRAVMPVHFSGLAIDMDRLYALAEKHGLRVIEDAAHAIGTSHRGRKIGSFGDIVCFSFHANKNLTTIEGAALSLPDEEAARRIEILRFHGITKQVDGTIDVSEAASKFNLTDVSARIGVSQLKQLDGFNAKRRALAMRYFEILGDDRFGVLPARGDEGHSWHMFQLLIPFAEHGLDRAGFRDAMHAKGIGVGMHYPALHLMTYYRELGHREGECPNAERIGRETVTLPLFPGMELGDVDRVCAALEKVLSAR